MPPKWPILCSSEKNYGQEEKEGGKTWNKSTTLFCIVSAAVLFLGNWLERTDFFSVQISFSLQVFIGNEKVFQIIEKSMPCRRFAELKIPLVFSYFLRAEDNKCLLCTHTETVVMFFLRGTICNDRHLRDLLYFNVLCNFCWILSFFSLLYLPYVDDSKQQTSLIYLLLKHFSCNALSTFLNSFSFHLVLSCARRKIFLSRATSNDWFVSLHTGQQKHKNMTWAHTTQPTKI